MTEEEYVALVLLHRKVAKMLEAATRERFPAGTWCKYLPTGQRTRVENYYADNPDLVHVHNAQFPVDVLKLVREDGGNGESEVA